MGAVDVDRTDLAVLRTLEKEGSAMWKKDIHRAVQSSDTLPSEVAGVSVQTIGRRIDTLHESGLLKPRIVTPENINRDLIIAYELTASGRETIARKREQLLREHVYTREPLEVPGEEEHIHLADLFADVVGLDREGREFLRECGGKELSTLIAAYYFQKDLDEALEKENLEEIEGAEEIETLQPLVSWMALPGRKTN